MKVFKGMKFSKVQMLEELSGGAGGILKLQIDWSITEDFEKKAQSVEVLKKSSSFRVYSAGND